jgi:hypothetical protein
LFKIFFLNTVLPEIEAWQGETRIIFEHLILSWSECYMFHCLLTLLLDVRLMLPSFQGEQQV